VLKKVTAILLLALLIYNAFGYYLLFAYEREQARVGLLQDLPDDAFQILKFKATLYTSVENTDFEFINENLMLEDKNYRIVKKRIQNDTVSYYYLRDFRQDELRQNLNEIVESQTIKDSPFHNSKPVKQLLKSFLKDYIPNDTGHSLRTQPVMITPPVTIPIAPASILQAAYLSNFTPPPEFV
jgi:hypothetical protein